MYLSHNPPSSGGISAQAVPRNALLLSDADYTEWAHSGGSDGAEDEVSIGEVIVDRSGDKRLLEHLTLHIDTLLTLFGVDVYRQIAALRAEDDPIPLTLNIDLGEASRLVRRLRPMLSEGLSGRANKIDELPC